MINNQNLAVLSEKVAYLEAEAKASSSASGITYDNTDSGLVADDVQAAIDEVNTKVTSIFLSDGIASNADKEIPLNNGVIIFAYRAGNANVYTVDNAGGASVGSANILTITQANGVVTIHNNLAVSCFVKILYY